MNTSRFGVMLFVFALVFILGSGVSVELSATAQRGEAGLSPGQGVEFQQVDFAFAEVRQANSDWGRLSVNVEQVVEATGLRAGFLNLFTPNGWSVINLPISLRDAGLPIVTYFSLGLARPRDVGELRANVQLRPEPIDLDEGQALVRELPLDFDFPVEPVVWNAEGVGGPTLQIAEALKPIDLISYWRETFVTHLLWDHTLPNAVNVQAATNQCFPMSIANGLQFLENQYGISMPHVHAIGQGGDNTLVGRLDAEANRPVVNHCSGSGVWFIPMMQGKLAYLSKSGLGNQLTHRHQGRGYGQLFPNGNFTHSGITDRPSSGTGSATRCNKAGPWNWSTPPTPSGCSRVG